MTEVNLPRSGYLDLFRRLKRNFHETVCKQMQINFCDPCVLGKHRTLLTTCRSPIQTQGSSKISQSLQIATLIFSQGIVWVNMHLYYPVGFIWVRVLCYLTLPSFRKDIRHYIQQLYSHQQLFIMSLTIKYYHHFHYYFLTIRFHLKGGHLGTERWLGARQPVQIGVYSVYYLWLDNLVSVGYNGLKSLFTGLIEVGPNFGK